MDDDVTDGPTDAVDDGLRQRVAELRTQLEAVGESLGDLALDLLHRAVDEGATSRPPAEKQLNQARRAVEKAVRTLDGI